jgi:hypothetical protein
VIVAPPVRVDAPTVTEAVVDDDVAAFTDVGAPGTVAPTPIVTCAIPVAVAPPDTVVEAVIV